MNIVGHRKIFFAVSGLLFLLSIASFLVWGLRLGIDFTGGLLIEVEFSEVRPDTASLKSRIADLGLGEVLFTPTGESGLIVRTGYIGEDAKERLLSGLSLDGGYPLMVKRFNGIGPTIGKELKGRSARALIIVILLIVFYVAWAFRKVSRPVPSWKYGVVTIVALVHDIALPSGLFVLLGRFYGVDIGILFVTALLTILGFSVHDTIVVFDRIRENLKEGDKDGRDFETVVNRSLNETIVRSINTSLTVLLALLAVFFFGGESIRFFSLALITGVIFGTYSSIFIAGPLLVSWHNFTQRKKTA